MRIKSLLVTGIAVVAATMIVVAFYIFVSRGTQYAITIDGVVEGRGNLSDDATWVVGYVPSDMEIGRFVNLRAAVDGAYNIVAVEGGRVSVTHANCPDKVCVRMGKVDGGSIICVPHKLILEVQ